MINPVYSMTVRALSGVVSERAAETMLRNVLREQGLSAEGVSAAEMQQVLFGPLLTRLTMVLPAARARRELQALALKLQEEYPKAPTLFAAPGEAGWEESADLTGGEWDDLNLDADDFEFDDPEYATAPRGRAYQLGTALGQDELMQHLGKLAGVQGVMVCRASGEVLRMRAIRDSGELGRVVAASALLFQKRPLRLLSADLGGKTVCVRPLGDYSVAVVVASQANVGRLLVELQQLRIAA